MSRALQRSLSHLPPFKAVHACPLQAPGSAEERSLGLCSVPPRAGGPQGLQVNPVHLFAIRRARCGSRETESEGEPCRCQLGVHCTCTCCRSRSRLQIKTQGGGPVLVSNVQRCPGDCLAKAHCRPPPCEACSAQVAPRSPEATIGDTPEPLSHDGGSWRRQRRRAGGQPSGSQGCGPARRHPRRPVSQRIQPFDCGAASTPPGFRLPGGESLRGAAGGRAPAILEQRAAAGWSPLSPSLPA